MLNLSNALPLLSVRNLVKDYPIDRDFFSREKPRVQAVSDISFDVFKGETLGLVGESGCGKSTLGRCILRLIEPTAGKVYFEGKEITSLPKKEFRKLRRKMQIIFQDPYASLNPRLTVEEALLEPLMIHRLYRSKRERMQRVFHLLDLCGLRKEVASRYPHEFSGGQRQRVCIARTLAVEPQFIICDEPLSALDVSIQAQIMNLLRDLQGELKLTYLFISHDLRVIEYLSTRVVVMYLGKCVEMGPVQSIYENPRHPYTKALLSSIPSIDAGHKKDRIILKGDVPSALSPPGGCHFHPRCPLTQSDCRTIAPSLRLFGSPGTENSGSEGKGACDPARESHAVSCHFA